MTLVAAFDKQSCNSDVINASNLAETLKSVRPDVLVDFTVAASSVEIIKKAADAGVRLVVGTTGFTPQPRAERKKAIEGQTGANISPKFSNGRNVFFSVGEESVRE